MNKQATVATIANDAINQLECAREYIGWFDSLAWAISSSLKQCHEDHAARLAGVVQYLAHDYHNMIDCDVKSLNEQLNTLSLRT
jgi:hypothetical protein